MSRLPANIDVLPPARRTQIDRLARRFSWHAGGRSPLPGRHRGPRLGSAGEFEGYRPYEPGDDLARLDLRVFARLRQRVIRLEREDSALPLTVLIDRSASMQGAARERAVAELAYFFLAVAGRGHDPTRLSTFGAGRLHHHERRRTHAIGAETLMQVLAAHPPAGRSDFERELAQLAPDPAGPGLLLILSDGLGFTDPARELAPLRRAGRLLWLAPLETEERDPRISGDVRIEPREPGSTWQGNVDTATLRAYRARSAQYFEAVNHAIVQLGGNFAQLAAEGSIGQWIQDVRRLERVIR